MKLLFSKPQLKNTVPSGTGEETMVQTGKHGRGGFTLIEVAATFMLMLMLSMAIVTLLSQHVFFMQLFNNNSFLAEDAPRVNALVGNIINQADSYFVFNSRENAAAGTEPVLEGGKALRLTFRNPSGVPDESILSYENGALNYHYKRGGVWSATPDWVVTSQPKNVTFDNSSGLLLVNLIGPEDEEITYAGTSE